MFTRKCSKFMQSKQESAFSAAASSSCANLFCMMLGAALLASILFVLLAILLAAWGILDVLVPLVVMILIGIVQHTVKKPESLA